MSVILYIHIVAGAIALIFGATSLFSKKGRYIHRRSGITFFYSMIVMALTGAYLAYLKPEMLAVLNSFFTLYLVVTAWLATNNKPNHFLGIF